jgi:hypothetical protein
LRGHQSEITSLSLEPQGRSLYSCSKGACFQWDWNYAEQVETLRHLLHTVSVKNFRAHLVKGSAAVHFEFQNATDKRLTYQTASDVRLQKKIYLYCKVTNLEHPNRATTGVGNTFVFPEKGALQPGETIPYSLGLESLQLHSGRRHCAELQVIFDDNHTRPVHTARIEFVAP